jgi:hypothetical protein
MVFGIMPYYADVLGIRGKESGIVRFSFEMLRTLGEIIEEEKQEEEQPDSPDSKRV